MKQLVSCLDYECLITPCSRVVYVSHTTGVPWLRYCVLVLDNPYHNSALLQLVIHKPVDNAATVFLPVHKGLNK
jgi:hypothetical protein